MALTCCFIIFVLACYLQFLEMFAWVLIIFDYDMQRANERKNFDICVLKDFPDIFWKSPKIEINFNFNIYV